MDTQTRYDAQVGRFYKCERCDHIFNWDVTQHLPNGTHRGGSRCCPRCSTEFVRKFRCSDMERIVALLEATIDADEGPIIQRRA